MSPGPSLAVVLRQSLGGGRRNGVIAALMHGFGVGLYALLSIFGLSAVVAASPLADTTLRWGGAVYLAWLGVKSLTARKRLDDSPPTTAPSGISAARDGFLVVFLNPKVAVFFIALFSQVVGTETSLPAKLVYAATALIIDAGWYLLVAWLFSSPRWIERLRRHSVLIERLFGAVLVGLAGRLITR